MNLVWRLLLHWLGFQAKVRAINAAKRRAVLAYLRTIYGVRLGLLGLLLGFLALQLMMLSFVGAVVVGFLLWDYDLESKLQILLGVFLGLFILPAMVLMVVFSQRFWFKVSGAQNMVRDLDKDSAGA